MLFGNLQSKVWIKDKFIMRSFNILTVIADIQAFTKWCVKLEFKSLGKINIFWHLGLLISRQQGFIVRFRFFCREFIAQGDALWNKNKEIK